MTAIADYQMQANAELSVVYYHGSQSGFRASMVIPFSDDEVVCSGELCGCNDHAIDSLEAKLRRLGGAGPFPQRFERLVVALRGDG